MANAKRVLVIDDDSDFSDYVSIVLSSHGYEVRQAASADEGMRILKQETIDLVILDVMMSYVLDGWSVSRQMRHDPRLCRIPILMVSAIVSAEEDGLFPKGPESKIDGFMSKPIEPNALVRRVAELIATSECKEGEAK